MLRHRVADRGEALKPVPELPPSAEQEQGVTREHGPGNLVPISETQFWQAAGDGKAYGRSVK